MLRDILANIVAPVLRLTGYRFSKAFRHGDTVGHQLVYACVNTIRANLKAEGLI